MSNLPESRIELPRVSICIPTFNNASMVADAIQSARAQTFAALEIVILDNHSSDGTPAVIREAAGDDPRVRVIRHQRNLGMTGNFNAALEHACGELMMILCADDVLEADCVRILAAALDSEPGCVLAACARTVTDESLKPLRIKRARSRPTRVAANTIKAECFAKDNIIGEPSAVMFRRPTGQSAFSERYSQLLDLDMWYRLLDHGDALLLERPLCKIRRHREQWSIANVRSGRILDDKRAFFREYASSVAAYLGPIARLRWDARMASSVVKGVASGIPPSASHPEEVFFPGAFPLLRVLFAIAYAVRSRARAA